MICKTDAHINLSPPGGGPSGVGSRSGKSKRFRPGGSGEGGNEAGDFHINVHTTADRAGLRGDSKGPERVPVRVQVRGRPGPTAEGVVENHLVVYHPIPPGKTLHSWRFWGSILGGVFYHRLGLDGDSLRL